MGYNVFRVFDDDIHEIFDFIRSVDGCTVLPHAYMVCPTKRLRKSKYADCSISDVFGIRFAVEVCFFYVFRIASLLTSVSRMNLVPPQVGGSFSGSGLKAAVSTSIV